MSREFGTSPRLDDEEQNERGMAIRVSRVVGWRKKKKGTGSGSWVVGRVFQLG